MYKVNRVRWHPVITERQAECLAEIANDEGYKGVAKNLGICYPTVNNHLLAARARSKSTSTIGATLYAIREGYLIDEET